MRFSQDENNRVCSGIFNLIRDYSRGVTDNSNPWVVPCEPFGKISWRFEEVYFLKCILEIDGFYEEIGRFLNSFNLDGEIKAALLRYQYDIVKKPSESGEKEIVSDYDFYDYFQNIYIDEYKPLEKVKTKLTAHDKWDVSDLFEYSKEIVWYGRNYARSLLSSSCYSPEVKRNTEV